MENKTLEIINLFAITSFVILSIIIFVFILMFKIKKKQLAISNSIKILKLNHENELLTYQIEIQEDTFTEIAREIHDNISLSLTLAKLNLNTLVLKTEEEDYQKINNSIDLISKSLIDLNNLSKSLDGDIIEKYGLIAALKNEISSINKIGTIEILINIIGHDRYLEHTVELAIYRIIQEAIKNSIIHARASKASLDIDYLNDKIYISFSDNGIGFDVNNPNKERISSGIKNMNNRAKLIHANTSIISSPGNGTTVILEIPTNSDYAKR
jgi:two-component system NarL family sensor kinase